MKRTNKVSVIHQIDSTYLGQLNTSYQKEGFGIQQTFNFDTYIGAWKANKIDGKGLIILACGTIIYANFIKDEMEGISIIDDGYMLRCGIYKNGEITGVGFEYYYDKKKWQMNRYHKGVSIETIKQQQGDINLSVPKMINIEQQLFFHLYNYQRKNYFQQFAFQCFRQQASQTILYCYQNQKSAYGPGIKLKNFSIVEAGFYENDLLTGYCLKKDLESQHTELAHFCKGKKDGFAIQIKHGKNFYYEYRKGAIIREVQPSQVNIQQKQKKYNYNCKDFFSAKNCIPFQKFNFHEKKIVEDKGSESKVKNQTPKSGKKYNDKQWHKTSDYLLEQGSNISSVMIMKRKINEFKNVNKNSSKKLVRLDDNYEDGDIADQENPFNKL